MPLESGSPEEWVRFAVSDLSIAGVEGKPGVMLETLCYHAQQAVEKSFKALLRKNNIQFPRTHNLKILFDLLPGSLLIPKEVSTAVKLTYYSNVSRYPGDFEPISEEDYREALELAKAVVAWAKSVLHMK